MLFKEAADKYSNIIQQDAEVRKAITILHNNPQPVDQDATMELQLYKSIFQQLWVKLQKKAFDVRRKYALTFTGVEAAAIHIEFAGIYPPQTFTGNLIMQLCNCIHQQFSSQ